MSATTGGADVLNGDRLRASRRLPGRLLLRHRNADAIGHFDLDENVHPARAGTAAHLPTGRIDAVYSGSVYRPLHLHHPHTDPFAVADTNRVVWREPSADMLAGGAASLPRSAVRHQLLMRDTYSNTGRVFRRL